MTRSGLIRPDPYGTPHIHPFQLYERFHGQVFLVFLFFYPLWRSLMETFRGDTERGSTTWVRCDKPRVLPTIG